MQTHLSINAPSVMMSHSPHPGKRKRKEGTFLTRNLYSAFGQSIWRAGAGREVFVSAVSQLLLVQNNPFAEVAYFGVPYSDPLQFTYCLCFHAMPVATS